MPLVVLRLPRPRVAQVGSRSVVGLCPGGRTRCSPGPGQERRGEVRPAGDETDGVVGQGGQDAPARAASPVPASHGSVGFPGDLPPRRRRSAGGAEALKASGGSGWAVMAARTARTLWRKAINPARRSSSTSGGLSGRRGAIVATQRLVPPTVESASMTPAGVHPQGVAQLDGSA